MKMSMCKKKTKIRKYYGKPYLIQMICFVRLQTSENKKKREIANSTVREMSTFRTTIIKNGTEKKSKIPIIERICIENV